MRKIIYNLAVTLDGFIEGPNGEFDWCFEDQDYGMTDFFHSIDTIFLGKASYELLLRMDENSFKDKKRIVFSRTLEAVREGWTLVNDDLKSNVERIKKEKGKHIWLFGGASLATSFLEEDLIDELMLAVHPILLGSGKRFFLDFEKRKPLKFQESKNFSSGLVQLIYSR